jgi:4-hydroxyphenylpyruvate dioxygenase
METIANPMGTDGFEFVEYTAPDPAALGRLFEQLGFAAVARHRSKDVTLYRQGGVNFIVNREPDGFAQSFARVHGPSACAFAIRVKDAAKAWRRALELGAKPHHGPVGPMELNIPVDHLTHNLYFGNMEKWADYYERLFNFREIRYFDIKGAKTGLVSKAMTAPDGIVRIPLNESSDPKSQINEYLDQYHGEGIQHIACFTDDIYATVERCARRA